MRYALIVLPLLLAACGQEAVRPTHPAAQVIEVPVETFVPIREELRQRCPWKKACRPSESIACSKERAVCLVQYEQQFDGIDAVQGKPVPR